MSGYTEEADILPCPITAEHQWVPVDLAPQPDGIIMRCGSCKACITRRWWGYEFYTGLELLDSV